MKINTKNLGISVAVTIGSVIAAVVLSNLFGDGFPMALFLAAAIGLYFYSEHIDASKYRVTPAWVILFIGPIGLLFVVYGLLQIRSGLAELKPPKKK